MSVSGWFEVTVYRVGESAHIPGSETYTAHSLTVSPDGSLTIEWDGGSHGFTSGAYDSFEFKRIRMPKR